MPKRKMTLAQAEALKNAGLAHRNPAAYAQMKADEAAKMPTLLDKESAMRIAQEKGWVILFNESTGNPRGVPERASDTRGQ